MDIDDLLAAFDDYLSARKELLACKESCKYESGYWCQDQQRDFDAARVRLDAELTRIIDRRIAKAAECRQKETP